MVRPKARVSLNPVRMSRTDNRIASNASVGTVRERHLWPVAGNGRAKPFCKWCGATRAQATGVQCVELQQAALQARIQETRGEWAQAAVAEAKRQAKAAREVERAAELARHAAKAARNGT